MKKQISTNLRWLRYFVLLFGLIVLYDFSHALTNINEEFEKTVVEIIFLFLFAGLYILLDNTKTVAFDSENLYITGKSNEEKIPLIDVVKVNLTTAKINEKNLWKITYQNTYKNNNSVTFLPINKSFTHFINEVKRVKPDVGIMVGSHPLEFND